MSLVATNSSNVLLFVPMEDIYLLPLHSHGAGWPKYFIHLSRQIKKQTIFLWSECQEKGKLYDVFLQALPCHVCYSAKAREVQTALGLSLQIPWHGSILSLPVSILPVHMLVGVGGGML